MILTGLVKKIGRWPQHHWSYFRFVRHLIIGAQSLYYTYTALQSYNLELKVWFSTWKPIFFIPTRVCTLCCIFLRRCGFGVKTRVIIKFWTRPCYPRKSDWFSWEWSKHFFLQKKIKMADSKNMRFSRSPILKTISQEFQGLSLV